jgi:hypothetical protein
MAYVHEIMAGNLEWGLFVVSVLVSALSDHALLILRRGFGGRGFGRRGFGPGRGLGAFRLIRILFVLLFTTVLGPIVLVVLVVAGAYWYFSSRR